MRVIVAGAGVIGAAVAFHLAGRGAAVTVVDAGTPGATGASFGWINASFHLNADHFRLRAEGIAAHRRLAARLPGCPTRWPGCLWYEQAGDAQDAEARHLLDLGYRVERRSRAQVAALIPALADPPETALFFPDEGTTDAADLARLMLAADGVRVLAGVAVTGLAQGDGRVTGVVTDHGVIAADHVVVAAGTGSPHVLHAVGLDLPMVPRPGLILTTQALPPVLPVILATPGGELRQLPDGRLLMPAAAQHRQDTADTLIESPETMADQGLARLSSRFPGLPLHWASATLAYRPVPAGGLPVFGATAVPGLSVAVMHSGVTLAAAAGEMLAAEILTGRTAPLAAPFRPGR
jgi:glycine/D-amino acid oxidase-like deaminating enzyme